MQLWIPKRASRDPKNIKVSWPFLVRQDDPDVRIPRVLIDFRQNHIWAHNSPLKWVMAGQAAKFSIAVDVKRPNGARKCRMVQELWYSLEDLRFWYVGSQGAFGWCKNCSTICMVNVLEFWTFSRETYSQHWNKYKRFGQHCGFKTFEHDSYPGELWGDNNKILNQFHH